MVNVNGSFSHSRGTIVGRLVKNVQHFVGIFLDGLHDFISVQFLVVGDNVFGIGKFDVGCITDDFTD
jgi:hypothetical protein